MATVTLPDQDRITVLDRLRGYIRAYVTLESAAQVGIYLALWFWLGMLLDFGVFKIIGLDWVQSLPWWGYRATILIILGSGLLALVLTRFVFRFWRQYGDRALALALERTFPGRLGDRLVTAVELADPRLTDAYHFSRPMVENTIDEARRLARDLPVRDVFDWTRVHKLYLGLAGVTFGIFILVGLGICTIGKKSVDEFRVRFGQTAAIWFERNILLKNTIWPRKAYLELIAFPESGEMRVGRDTEEKLQVRALKWVIADDDTAEGWRALMIADIDHNLTGGYPVPKNLPANYTAMSMDAFEARLDNPEAQLDLGADIFLYWRNVVSQLRGAAESPRMARKLRLLQLPEQVVIFYRGETTRSEQTLDRKENNEFTAKLSDLRESSRFFVKAMDYSTAVRRVTIVPPPLLTELVRDEEQPAYLYQRPPVDGTPADLKGKRQFFASQPISLSGNVSRMDVPTGTSVVLRGVVDKDLAIADPKAVPPIPPGVQVKPTQGSAAFTPMIEWDKNLFSIRIENITQPLSFEIVLTDPDRVISGRQIQIKPVEDSPPEVDVIVEVVRKTRDGYMVTPMAKVPLSGRVRDDRGLERVDYKFTLLPLDAQTAAAGPIVSALGSPMAGPTAAMMQAAYIGFVARMARVLTDETGKTPQTVAVASFAKRLQEHGVQGVALERLAAALKAKPEKPLLRDIVFDPDEERFNIASLNLKVPDEREIQPRYRLKLWISAQDGNVDTVPGIGESKEKLTFQVVSENELLAEIARDEEGLHLKLEDVLTKLKDARNKLDQVGVELPALKKEEFSPMARRAEEILETLSRSSDISQEVHRDYLKILKELKVNLVQPKIIEKVERNICEPLEGILRVEFVASERSMKEFHKTLEAAKADPASMAAAKEDLNRLIERLLRVLDAMGDITTINKLIQQLAQIETAERKASDRFKETYDRLREDFLDEAFKPQPKKPKE